MQEIRATAEWQQATDVVIFVHGGLNSLNGGIERATQDWARLKEGMENDPERKGCLTVYPVFINWESGAFNGYVDHLVWYRRGQSRWWGPLTAPFVLAIDIVRAIGVAPVHYFQQLTDILEQFGKVPAVTVPANWRNNVRIDDRVDLSAGVKWRDRATFWTIGMIRPATIPLAQLWLGEAYPMIERRVHTLFTTDDNLGTETSSSAPEGAIHELFVALAAKVNPPKVTILAHSMGTIVANQILVSIQSTIIAISSTWRRLVLSRILQRLYLLVFDCIGRRDFTIYAFILTGIVARISRSARCLTAAFSNGLTRSCSTPK